MDKMSVVAMGVCACVLIFCLAMLPSTMKRERICREQGGIGISGVCIKADTIKVVQ